MPDDHFLHRGPEAFGVPVCRLGLASRGSTNLRPADVLCALDLGVNFLNWAGHDDAFCRAIAELGASRRQVVVCVQFEARGAREAEIELDAQLRMLGTDYVDVLTFYYVEAAEEWHELTAAGGALEFCRQAQRDGRIRRLGVTTHQRRLAVEMATSGQLDLLMLRYNAAHRGAEHEVFPVTTRLHMPVIAYTALRWGALLQPTPDDLPGFDVSPASAWYRFVLQSPAVTVVLAAPNNPTELTEALRVLNTSGPLAEEEYALLAEHGRRVRRHAGSFP